MTQDTPDLHSLLQTLFYEHSLISIVLSNRDPKQPLKPTKITIRPVYIQQKKMYQVSEQYDKKIEHHNFSLSECLQKVYNYLTSTYKQAQFYSAEADNQILISKKGKMTFLKKKPTQTPQELKHNRKKNYLLEEGEPIPFLIDLGILSASGKILEKKRDKFVQINKFLELIEDVIHQLEPRSEWNIIDFGCGKAYLTFALYYYLHIKKNYKVQMTGLDLKQDVIAHCQELANRLGYDSLKFQVGEIQHHQTASKVDMVIALHACDTATDAALEKAVFWEADAILSVPCCQHELYSQVQNPILQPLLKHGILKERFAALITDAARGQLLEICGYQTQILEFIDLEHTAKNLMIRAIKKGVPGNIEKLRQNYEQFTKFLQIENAQHLNKLFTL